MPHFPSLQRRSRRPRLPWKRGPRAWEIAQRADSVLATLRTSHQGFYSLRRAARLLGISTQPLRDWVRLGQMRRDGPRGQISRAELERVLNNFVQRAEPFSPYGYLERIELHRRVPRRPWRKLGAAQFVWPAGRDSLTPVELAGLIGCHPSLVLKAVRAGRISGQRPSPGRWAITRRAWRRAFFL